MSSRPAGQEKLPKKDRKALARELARIEREREARRRRRNRRLGRAGAGTAVVAVAVVAVLAVQASARAGQVGPHNMLADGVVLGGDGTTVTASRTSALDPGQDPTPTVVDRSTGVLDLVLYVDYASPEAAAFWSAGAAGVEQWVTAGSATLELHPLALETAGDYSARAAGALACVADTVPDSALAVHDALLAAQPDLDQDGLDDDELLALVQGAGVTDQGVADCVTGGDFTDWAQQATDRAASGVPFDVGAVTTSPVLLVGGQEYTGALDDPDALAAFVEQVGTQLEAEAAAG
ncbi:DsbA family protein [Cellulomonas sp. Marseille-Q8402]